MKKGGHSGVLPPEDGDVAVDGFPRSEEGAGLGVALGADQFPAEPLQCLEGESMLFVKITGDDEASVRAEFFEGLVEDFFPGAVAVPVVLVAQENEVEVVVAPDVLSQLGGVAAEKLEFPFAAFVVGFTGPPETLPGVGDLSCPHVEAGQLHGTVGIPLEFGDEIGEHLGLVAFPAGDVEDARFFAGGEVAGVPFAAMIADRLHLPGRLSRTELIALYRDADVYVAPGVDDAFSVAVQEAQAAGLAIVSRSQSGAAELLEDGVTGLLAPDDDALSRAVVRLVTDADLLERITSHNREVPPQTAWPQVLTETMAAYEHARTLVR